MLNFVVVFSLIFTSLVAGTPVPGSDDIWTKYLPTNDNFTSPDILPRSIGKRDVGPEINSGFYPDWKYCKSNPADVGQCTLTFFDHKQAREPVIWLFDNNCKIIGLSITASRAELATEHGYAFTSEKPRVIDIHYVGENLVATRDVSWNYAGRHILPAEGDLWKKWQAGYSGMHHFNDDWAFRFAFDCY
ncbi:hypothetical protein VTL71DRAFT_8786 [Oculimacula yallundae]|uniref:Uncharacterized protein n=1 Tax=Oculimacula yallundae TaxID=86028 RepID=A0ABR4CZS0_9HELO